MWQSGLGISINGSGRMRCKNRIHLVRNLRRCNIIQDEAFKLFGAKCVASTLVNNVWSLARGFFRDYRLWDCCRKLGWVFSCAPTLEPTSRDLVAWWQPLCGRERPLNAKCNSPFGCSLISDNLTVLLNQRPTPTALRIRSYPEGVT